MKIADGGRFVVRERSERLTVIKLRNTRVYLAVPFIIWLLTSVSNVSLAISPSLSGIESTNLGYTEGQAATAITSALLVADSDSPTLTSAVIWVSSNYTSSEDLLTFTNVSGITGSFDLMTGTLTLSGSATLLNYRSALRSIAYRNTNSDNPSTVSRTISFSVNDGTTNSNTVTRTINILAVNDLPVISNLGASPLAYTEEDMPSIISSTLNILDVDNSTITGATIQLTTNFSTTQDRLDFTSASGITGVYNSTTGILALTGIASIAAYEDVLRSVTYQNINTVNPSTLLRTVTYRVNDGTANSAIATRTIAITALNDAPVLSAIESTSLSYTESQAAQAITANVLVADGDNTNLASATVQLTGNYYQGEDILSYTPVTGISGTFDVATGTMVLSGTSTLTNYRTALRGITFRNTNNADPSTLTRTISFTVNDGAANSNVVTRTITLNAVNDIPVLTSLEPANLAYEEGQSPIQLLSSISITDVDNLNLTSATIQIVTGFNTAQDILSLVDANGITSSFNSISGTLTLTGSATKANYETALRSVTYRNTNEINPTTPTRIVRFIVNDGTANSAAVNRSITFTATNDAPVVAGLETSNLIYTEGQAATAFTTSLLVTDGDSPNLTGATVQLTGNFVNTEDVLSFSNATGVTGSYNATTGTVTFTGTSSLANYQTAIRSVRYRNSNNNTPSPLERTISVTLNDGSLLSQTVSRAITVTPVNDVPTMVNDIISTPEETDVVITVLANDSDVDDTIDPTTVVIVTNPVNGTATVNALTGAITYSPNAQFSGTNSFTYTVRDLVGGTSLPATVTVTVSLINDAPYFTQGADIIVNEDAVTQSIVGWATGINDGDPFTTQTLTFAITNTNSALFSTQPSINSTTGTLTFRSATNATGLATLTVALRDNGLTALPHVNISDVKTFTIQVLPINDAPLAVDDFYSTSSNTPLTSNARSNDSDPENNTMTFSSTPVSGPSNGIVVINSDGVFTYTPNSNFTGTDLFIYEVCDNGTDIGLPAARCSQATVSVTVNPANTFFNIVGNNSIEISPNSFILTKALNTQQGAVWNRMPLDLRYSFDLNLNAMFSAPGEIRDTGADGIIFVLQRDDTPPPLNVPDLPIFARGSTGEYLGVGGVSPSIGVEVDTYQNGGEPAYDHIAISKNGSVYDIVASPVPALLDVSGNPLNIEDGVEHTVLLKWDYPTKTLSMSFDGIQKVIYNNDIIASIFNNDPTNVYWGFSSSTGGQNNYQAVYGITMNVINLPPVATPDAATTDEDLAVTGNVLTNDLDPEAGSIRVVAETKTTPHGQVTFQADGSFLYTPVTNYNGQDTFTYQVCDAFSPNGCSTGTVTVTINPIQDAPVGTADVLTVNEDTPVDCGCLLHNDTDADNEALIAILASAPANGTILNIGGNFVYQPNPDFFGTDTFTYYANDGLENSAETLVTITVLPINDAPVAADDQFTINEDVPSLLALLVNDNDVDDVLAVNMIIVGDQPANGMLEINSTGTIYTPNLNYFGSDSFTYTIKDAAGAVSNVATVNIVVNSINDAPVGNPDTSITPEEVPISIAVLLNDSDVDNALDPTSAVISGNPAHGSATVEANAVIYTPSLDFNGNDSFTYTVKDIDGAVSAPITVTVTVTPVNDAPVAVDDVASTLENISVSIPVLLNDYDVDDVVNSSSVVIILNPLHGDVVYEASTGLAIYTPEADYTGNDSFTYSIHDDSGLSSEALVNITVLVPNRAPTAVDDGPIVHAFLLPLTIDVLVNDFDIDNEHDDLTIVSVTNPSTGTVSLVDGKIIYYPEGTQSGTVTFTYTIQDPSGLTDEATVTIEYVYNPLQVSEAFTPNNDSNNDTWYILSIENYPNNSVKIFDRWGLLVYQKQHYENTNSPWDGRGNSGQQNGKLLDQGTYYYMLETGGELKMLSGFVMIVR